MVASSVTGEPYTTVDDYYNDGVLIGQTFLSSDSSTYLSDVVASLANGEMTETFDGGSALTSQPYSSFTDEYDNGSYVGAVYDYVAAPGSSYTNSTVSLNGAGALIAETFTGVSSEPFSSYEYDFVDGVYAGAEYTFTSVPTGASYSSYVVDESPANTFSGEQFFFTDIAGQSYTGEEEDFDANSELSRVVLTGVTGQAYSSLELDYSAGTYEGYKAYYDVTGQTYTNEEVDVSASGQLKKVIYSGMTSTPYSSVEQDYSDGALADSIYSFTDVTGASYNAYQVEENASGTALQETLDLNSGGHALSALSPGKR